MHTQRKQAQGFCVACECWLRSLFNAVFFLLQLAHFHDIVHGTRHDYYMNELRIEFLDEWIELLERKGFDPAALEMSSLGEKCLRHVVF